MAAIVLFVVGIPVYASSPVGVQCPTAPVQSVLIDGIERAPQPGDVDFQPCHCAEKKTAPMKSAIAQKTKETVWFVAEFLPVGEPPIAFHAARIATQPCKTLRNRLTAPPVPPPNQA